MAEEAEVDIQDVSLLDNDIAPTSDDTPTETPPTQGEDEAGAGQDKQTTEEDKTIPEGEQTPESQKTEAPATDDEAARKAQNEYYARQRILERQRVKETVQEQIDQNYGPKTAEELADEGLSDSDAKYEALRQEIAYKEERTRIAELNAGMQAEAVNIKADFPVFNPDSPDYDPEFERMVADRYQRDARLQLDENGIVINAEARLYDYYQEMVDIYGRGASKGQTQAQADAQAMMARTENPGGSSSTSKGGDSLAELEERLGDIPIV